MSYTFPEPDEVALLILHKHAKVRVEDLAEEKHEKLLSDTTIILTLLISKYDLVGGGQREGRRWRRRRKRRRRRRRRERERERERERNEYIHANTCTAQQMSTW